MARLSIAILLILGQACATNAILDDEAVKRSWTRGQHLLPASALQANQFSLIEEIGEYPDQWGELVAAGKLKPGVTLPAVIYLHGCAGNRNGLYWAGRVNKLGYAFFAPDSMARPRQSLCDSGNMKNIRIPMRSKELAYALRQLQSQPWIDRHRLVLIGFSEGAQTAAAYRGSDFAAIILLGTNCQFSGGSPRAPAGTALLALMGQKDHYYSGVGCRVRHNTRGSKSIVIKGAGHNLRNNPEAVEAFDMFLQQILLR